MPSWSRAKLALRPAVDDVEAHECRVGGVIRALPLLALLVADMDQRDRVERGVIALLSDATAEAPMDPPCAAWLGSRHRPGALDPPGPGTRTTWSRRTRPRSWTS